MARSARADRLLQASSGPPRDISEFLIDQRHAGSRIRLTAEQAREFLDATRDDRLGPLYVLALATGLRQGELLAIADASGAEDGPRPSDASARR